MSGEGNGHVNGNGSLAPASHLAVGGAGQHVKMEGSEQPAAAMSSLKPQQQPASLLRKPVQSNGSSNGVASSSKVQAAQQSPLSNGTTMNGTTHAYTSPAAASTSITPAFDPLFQPRSIRSWEKSRKLDDEQAIPSRAELEAQLRPEDEGLVPLSAIAGRVVHYAWQLFANQAEINPSISPLERRKRIYDDAHEARKQLIKLLVLAQWSKSAPELHTARNLIALINDHFVQTDAAVSSLEETRTTLNNARLRRYDLPTAIEVLTNGEPKSIPPAIRDAAQPQKPFSDAQAIQLVHELDDVLRFRLASRETLPMALSKYTIADGRASFVAPDFFEADLTVSGDREEDRWWLLRVKFDFDITGEGIDRFPKQPRSQQRLQILAMADAELMPRSVAAAAPGLEDNVNGDDLATQSDPQLTKTISDDTSPVLRRDMPLVRLYNLLQMQSLLYRLNILHWQAAQLCRFGWASCAQVSLDGPRSVSIRYWNTHTTARPARPQASQVWNPTSPGKISIKVESEEEQEGTSRSILSSLFASIDDRVDKPQKLSLVAQWDVDSVASRYIDSADIAINHHSLNAEAILESATQRHALAAASAFEDRLQASSLAKTTSFSCRLAQDDGGAASQLFISLYDGFEVMLSIQSRSGQLSLAESRSASQTSSSIALEDLTSSARFRHVKRASERLNEEPHAVVAILQDLRREVLLGNLEQQCRLAGLACTSKLPLRLSDLAQLGTQAGAVLFVPMPPHTSFYLPLQIGEDALRATIICADTFLEGTLSIMRLVGQTRLDRQAILEKAASRISLGKRKRGELAAARDGSDNPLLTTEAELRTLHSYCVALIGYQKIEQQLRQRAVDCFYVPPKPVQSAPDDTADEHAKTGHAVDLAYNAIPHLCLRTSTVFGDINGSGLGTTMLMRLRRWNDPMQCRAVFSMHAILQLGSRLSSRTALDGFDEVMYSEKKKRLTFVIADIGNCIDRLLVLWRRVERVLDLVHALARCPKPAGGSTYKLDSFDLMHVRFAYDDGLLARVGWLQNSAGSMREGFYTLEFSSQDDQRVNPHALLCNALQIELNRGYYRRAAFWPRFMALLHATLPVAKATYELPVRSETDADCPEVEVKSAAWLRLVFLQSYSLDVRLVQGNRFLLCDAGRQDSSLLSVDGIAQAKRDAEDISDEFTIETITTEGEDVGDAKEVTPKALTSTSLRPIPAFDKIVRQLIDEIKEEEDDRRANSDYKTATIGMTNALIVPWDATKVKRLITSAIAHVQKSLADNEVSVDEKEM